MFTCKDLHLMLRTRQELIEALYEILLVTITIVCDVLKSLILSTPSTLIAFVACIEFNFSIPISHLRINSSLPRELRQIFFFHFENSPDIMCILHVLVR